MAMPRSGLAPGKAARPPREERGLPQMHGHHRCTGGRHTWMGVKAREEDRPLVAPLLP